MIKLQNVSKYYYRKGMVASGIAKVDLEFDIGEFIVITGESGSGKSTLLNVISGVDTYEEGEMYIDGKETSHYSTEDFEDYRRRYIANIFQGFNLINSYTVKQNVELILEVNGYDKDEIAKRVPKIIEQVGLEEYTNTKVSKLSGGQQQRVSIARALAKDTAIITADEPTGNLDSESAEGVVKLLHEIAKNKLVIIVTHNFEQFEQYATRIIKMSDGHVSEDNVLQEAEKQQVAHAVGYDKMRPLVKARIGVRNAFNIVPKFLLLLAVFLFMVVSVTAIYVNIKNNSAARNAEGSNEFFSNYSNKRIVVRHQDKTPLTKADYATFKKIKHVTSIAKDDVLLDQSVYIEDDSLSFYGYPYDVGALEGSVDQGENPKADNEVAICINKDSLGVPASEVIGKTCDLSMEKDNSTKIRIKISGVKFTKEKNDLDSGKIYVSGKNLAKLRNSAYMQASTVITRAGKQKFKYTSEEGMYMITVSGNVTQGNAIVPEELDAAFPNGTAKGKKIKISAKNMYYTEESNLKVAGVYTEKNYKKLTGKSNFEDNMSQIFINREDYKKMFTHDNYQSSVFVDDAGNVEEVKAALESGGYKALDLKNALMRAGTEDLIKVIQVPLSIILLIAVFFISYFVIRLILRSRNAYFGILRMLGLPRKDCRRILDVELLTIVAIAYGLFLAVILVMKMDILGIEMLKTLVSHMQLRDFFILPAMLLVIAYLVSGRFTRSLFKDSAMNNYREEA